MGSAEAPSRQIQQVSSCKRQPLCLTVMSDAGAILESFAKF